MLKLKQLREQKAKAAAEAAKKTGANAADTPEDDSKKDSEVDGNAAAEPKKENVFSLKTGGAKKGKTRANAAQLRAQKGLRSRFFVLY